MDDPPTAEVQRHLTITDHTLDDVGLQRHCPLHLSSPATTREEHNENDRLSPTTWARPTSEDGGLGRLRLLPVELLTDVLLRLDIPSLTVLQRVSRGTASLVDTLPRWSAMRRHCPDVLRAAVAIRADSFSCDALYETLRTDGCATCRGFGNYLYLITCRRVCFLCFETHADYMPVSSTRAARATGLSVKAVKQRLPHIRSVPGRYGVLGRKYKSRSFLFDAQAVLLQAGGGVHDDDGGGPAAVEDVQRGGGLDDPTLNDPRRFMSIITAPYFGPSIDSVDWGFYCHTCATADEPATDFRNHYTAQGILDHINQHHPGAVMKVVPDRDRARPWLDLPVE